MPDYPKWFYFPPRARPPTWVRQFIEVVRSARSEIESASVDSLTSDKVLAFLRPGLLPLGYQVEAGKKAVEKIRRPVLFGDHGHERAAYEVDAVHDELGIVVEVETGRGHAGTRSTATSSGRR